MTITVVGLGKIGLPLAVQYARSGEQVIGADIDARVVDLVNAGAEPFPGETDLATSLFAEVTAGRLTATTDTASAVRRSEVVVVVVPLFVDADDAPDFAWMDAATDDLGRGLRAGTLVVYETTLPVGTTRNRWKPRIEDVSGLTEGHDFHLAFSPERVLTGRVFADLRKYPKLVGGLTDEGSKRAVAFYERVLQFDERPDLPRGNGVWDLGSAEAAEMAKLAETTYRDVNIGLANQFSRFAMSNNIDFDQIIAATNSQPYSNIHRPGISVGGHCIPVYPRLYLWSDPAASIVAEARRVNNETPSYWIEQARAQFGSLRNARVALLGAAYRGGVKETAFSGVFPIARELADQGARVSVHDPLYSQRELVELGFTPYQLGTPTDIAIIQTDHDQYQALNDSDLPEVRLVVDGRNVIDPDAFSHAGVIVVGKLSRPGSHISTT